MRLSVRFLIFVSVWSVVGCKFGDELVLVDKSSKLSASTSASVHDLPGTLIYDLSLAGDLSAFSFQSEDGLSVDSKGRVFLTRTPAADKTFAIIGTREREVVHLDLTVNVQSGDLFSLRTWGDNTGGKLLDGNQGNVISAPSVPTLTNAKFKQVSAGYAHTCGVVEDGTGYCWGLGTSGQLGNGLAVSGTAPIALNSSLKFKAVYPSASSWGGNRAHTCGIAIDGTVHCWGKNQYGQLGEGTTTDRVSPTPIASDERFVSLAVANNSTCGLTMTHKIFCWGDGTNGQLGQGGNTASSTPLMVSGTYSTLVTGQDGYCALGWTDQVVYCWGVPDRGGVDYISNTFSSTVDDAMPMIRVPTLFYDETKYTTLAGGASSFCGVTEDATINCWGHQMYGRLGIGNYQSHSVDFYGQLYVPYPINTSTQFKSVAIGQNSSCAITINDQAWCWGRNEFGLLGVGNTTTDGPFGFYSPVALNDGNAFGAISVGNDYYMGLVKLP